MQAAASSILRAKAIEPFRIGFRRSLSWMRARGYSCSITSAVLRDVELQELARGELVIEPVDRAVLQVSERIVLRRAGQLVLAEHGLLLPGVDLIGRVRRRLAVLPVAALDGLAAVSPGRDALGIDHLTLDVEAADDEVVAGVLQVLEDRARVLPHQDRVRGVVVDAELIADAVPLADPVERDPHPRRVGDVVVEVVADGPARHRALLDAVLEPARLRLLEQRDEDLLEEEEVLIHRQLLVAADEAADRLQTRAAPRRPSCAPRSRASFCAHRCRRGAGCRRTRCRWPRRPSLASRRARAWPAPCRTACADRACSRPGRASPRAARRSRSGAGRPRSGCSDSRARGRTPASPRWRGPGPRRGSGAA